MKRIYPKGSTLWLSCVCILLLVAATGAYADVYRVVVEVTTVDCPPNPWTYCSLLESLSLTPGASAVFMVEYDPDAVPTAIIEHETARYKMYPAMGVSFITTDGSSAPVPTEPYYDKLQLQDCYDVATAPDLLNWSFHMAYGTCPGQAPCLRLLDPTTHHGTLSFSLLDTSQHSLDDFELPEIIDYTSFDHRHGFIRIEPEFYPRIRVLFDIISMQRWEASDMIDALVERVIEINVNHGVSNALDAKLSSALEALDEENENNDVSAINRMQAFINAVEAQRGNQISDDDADVRNNTRMSKDPKIEYLLQTILSLKGLGL